MNLKYFLLVMSSFLALAACEEELDIDVDTDLTPAIDLYVEAIQFSDPNLEQCVKEAIAEQGVATSDELVNLRCDEPISDVHGLQYFTELRNVDLIDSGLSCQDMYLRQIELSERGAVDEKDLDDIAVVVDGVDCFYNDISFNDSGFKSCVADEVMANGWQANSQVTQLTCSDENLMDIGGIESFDNLVYLNLVDTAVPCADIDQLATANPLMQVEVPLTCSVANIEFSDEMTACVMAQAPDSGLVLNMTSLVCDDTAIDDLMGVDKLTSLTTLDLAGTSVNCEDLRDLSYRLINTDVVKPDACSYQGDDLISSVAEFSDAALNICFDRVTASMTNVSELTNLNCAGGRKLEQDIAVLHGIEDLPLITSVTMNNTKVEDLTPLKYLPSMTYLSLFNAKRLNSGDLHFINEHFSGLTNLNIGGATGMTDFSKMDLMTNLKFLGIANLNLTGNDDLGAVENMTGLERLVAKNNKITNLDVVTNLVNLTEINLQNNPGLTSIEALHGLTKLKTVNLVGVGEITCAQVDAFLAAMPEPETVTVQSDLTCN